MERDLLGKVDLVVATADTLFDAKSALHPRVRLLKHGVDWERFRSPAGTAPAELRALPRPRAGCVGLVDELIDAAGVAELARARPDVAFVFVGPRQLPPGPLDSLENVHFLPPVPYEQVPAVLAELDVALLPYLENALTERINPLKLREFLASGIPVVATPLPEVKPFAAWVELARDPAEWAAGLTAALREGRARSGERSASVREDGWDHRADEFLRLCREAEETARAASTAGSGPGGGP
jgi:glycosyltransferase involved in cell wall biosynthesis